MARLPPFAAQKCEESMIPRKDHSCDSQKCTWGNSELGCITTSGKKENCGYRYDFGDLTYSQSCRCVGGGALHEHFGNLDKAFEEISRGKPEMNFTDFDWLLKRYHAPYYTIEFEFRRSDMDKSGTLSKCEFLR